MFRKQHYIALSAVTLTAMLVLNLPLQVSSRLKTEVGASFLPLFGLKAGVQQLSGKTVDSLTPRSGLIQEIENLRHENEELKVRQQQAEALWQENNRLRAAVGWQQQRPWKLKLAHVVLHDPANWWRTIQIDAGTRDGVHDNSPVLTSDGLVGRVSSAESVYSQVVLLGDPNCRVSALVENPGRDVGILSASGPLESSLADLTYLSGNANLKPGQQVITSGLGGVFPAGIPIGQIVDSRHRDFGLYTEARVKLSANLGALDEVWVLIQ